MCHKTKILLYTQGKRRRCQLRTTTKPSGRPSPVAPLRQTIPPVLNSTALGEQVGLELSGRQQVWSEPSRWKGRIKSAPPNTAKDGWRAKLSKWHRQTEQPRQIRRRGSKRRNKQAKQNKGEKNGTVFHFRWLFFFLDFVVWAFVSSKQPQEESMSSSEFQAMHKNKFENHSDKGRCDGLRASTSICFAFCTCRLPLQGGKKRHLKSGYFHRGTTCR